MSARPVVDVDETVASRSPRHFPAAVNEAAKPLYAYVGALDLAIEQAKVVPAQVRNVPAQVRTIPAQGAYRVSPSGSMASPPPMVPVAKTGSGT